MANSLTLHGKKKLENRLQELLAERDDIVARVVDARAQGDLSENAEYDNAREEQEQNQASIDEIEAILADVEIIPEGGADIVALGSSVTLNNGSTYKIVGPVEAAPLDGKISNESPLGQALIGKKVGDKAEYKTNSKSVAVKIKAIS
ncbi:transcription elongation factor GreA [Candidatus Saccharibacteria bacterium]|jgi:transcription elongation factor GreA|nr:transcription elongation factor GreA [Candidatus Saccharibacteria bacterium]